MPKIVRLNKRNWPKLLRRSELDTKSVMPRVRQILNRVKKEGDRALFQLELELDGSRLRSLEVSDEEIVDAYEEIGERKVRIIREAARIIERFHRKQLPKERISHPSQLQKSEPSETVQHVILPVSGL